MKAIIIIGILIAITLIIGIILIYFIYKRGKEIDRLFSEIQDVKNFLMID